MDTLSYTIDRQDISKRIRQPSKNPSRHTSLYLPKKKKVIILGRKNKEKGFLPSPFGWSRSVIFTAGSELEASLNYLYKKASRIITLIPLLSFMN